MIDLRRRGFLFGAAAAALIVPERKFYLLPPVREIGIEEGYDEQGFYWARRTVDVAGTQWQAMARVTLLPSPNGAIRLHARQAVMQMQPPQPAWKTDRV